MIEVGRGQVLRQLVHWSLAVERLAELDDQAAPEAWSRLEQYLGLRLRQHLTGVTRRLLAPAAILRRELEGVRSAADLERVQHRLVALRAQYLRAETTVDFFVDAVNTRTNAQTAGLLRACDQMAVQAMREALRPLGRETVPALSYLDRGLGASILKAGLRLWDGGALNPVAAIKVVRHNVFRTTALIHEAGHQVAHISGWNDELRALLSDELGEHSRHLGEVWSSWASEIAADAFAFVHTGYAAIAGLHDVLAGSRDFVFRLTLGDPHPTSLLRVLLGVAMARNAFGDGPWDDLARDWERRYPLAGVEPELARLVVRSRPLLDAIATAVLERPMESFGGRPLVRLIDPRRVSPAALSRLESEVGPALYTSSRWLSSSAVRLLALSGLRMAERPEHMRSLIDRQREWMLRLGRLGRATAA